MITTIICIVDMKWLEKTNRTFSLLCGEKVTNKEVVLAHAGVIAMVTACCFAEWINNL